MDFIKVITLFGFVVLMSGPSSADLSPSLGEVSASEPPPPTCNITGLPHGIVYKISRPPSSTSCSTSWELRNGTVIARDAKFNPNLVHNLTRDDITLKHCQEYLMYREDCDGLFEDMPCEVNCSSLHVFSMNQDPRTVNPTKICFSPTWCVEQLYVGILCAAGVVAVLAACAALFGFFKFKKRRAAYTPPIDQVKAGVV